MDKKLLKIQWKWMGWTTAFVLIAALFITGAAFAESGEPEPSEPPQEITQAPAEEAPAEEAPAADENTTAPDSETPPPPAEEGAAAAEIEDEVPSDEILIEEGAPAELSVEGETSDVEVGAAEIQANESEVVVADAAGEPLDMASQQTAELLASGDPYYWVGTKKYAFVYDHADCPADAFYCQADLDPIDAALAYMVTNTGLPSNRLLYVEGDNYDGFTIDGETSPLLSLLKGVIGVDGSQTTIINGDITVSKTKAGFTLQGFTIQGGAGLLFDSNIGTLKISDVVVLNSDKLNGIEVSNHSGAIVLERVESSQNKRSGASLNNAPSTSPITITDSVFSSNGVDGTGTDYGLKIKTNGAVTLNGIIAKENHGDGIYVEDYGTLKIYNAFLDKNQGSDPWSGDGLRTSTDGSGTVYLENVYAKDNDNGMMIIGGSLSAKNIEASHNRKGYGLNFESEVGSARVEYGIFNENPLDGLYIVNKGAIYLNSIEAIFNGANGLYLDNAWCDIFTGTCIGAGSVTITSPKAGGSQLANGFWNNGNTGIYIQSRGAVTIANIDILENGGIGLDIDNRPGTGGVTINTNLKNWENYIAKNNGCGIDIRSNGTVKISTTRMDSNQGDGITVTTFGNIELANVRSESNIGKGAFLNNADSALPRTVKFTDCSFDHNQGDGLVVRSRGAISANGLSANGNSYRNLSIGAYNDVITYHDLLDGSWVEDIYTFTNDTIGNLVDIYLSSNDFDSYLELWAPSGSQEAFDDDGWGGTNAHISKTLDETGTYTILVRSNDFAGEYLFSLNDPTQLGNPQTSIYHGAFLDNSSGMAGVTIKKPKNLDNLWGNFFDHNTGHGIVVKSNSSISLDSLNAYGNFKHGLFLSNPTSRASVSVVNTRTDGFESNFSNNGLHGVAIETLGNVTIKNMRASDNSSDGVYIDNRYDGSGFGSVMVLASSDRQNDFSYNQDNGLIIYSNGNVLLTNLYAEGNTSYGVYVSNAYEGKSGYVKVTSAGKYGNNNFIDNHEMGLFIISNGSITLNKVTAHNNQSFGAYLSNSGSTAAPPISITQGEFWNNGLDGVYVRSKGNITWKLGGASGNGHHGAYLHNNDGTGSVTVSGSGQARMQFHDNGWEGTGFNGMEIVSNGQITLGYADASNNNGHGFYISNKDSAINQKVVVTEASMNRNYYSGLFILSAGSVAMKNINTYGNDQYGIFVDNATYNSGSSPVTYQSTGKEFYQFNNGSTGLYIYSKGNVTINNQYGLSANNNHGDYGIAISNTASPVPSYVKLINVGATGNNQYGLYVASSGYIYAKSLRTEGNSRDGAYLYSSSGTVTISGDNYFRFNGEYGLKVEANGAISVSKAVAWNNGFEGVALITPSGNITVANITAAENGGTGVRLEGAGNFSINKVLAFNNGWGGFSGRRNDGLSIKTTNAISAVTIMNSTIMNNVGSGIEIEHPNPLFSPYLYMTNYNGNGEANLYVHTP